MKYSLPTDPKAPDQVRGWRWSDEARPNQMPAEADVEGSMPRAKRSGVRRYLLPFRKIDKEDVSLVGARGADLGQLVRAGFAVPPGLVLTTEAYFDFLENVGLRSKVDSLLGGVKAQDEKKIAEASKLITKAIERVKMPAEIESEIRQAYKELGDGKKVAVTVSSSGAGAEQVYPNVVGAEDVVVHVKMSWAANFSSRALADKVQRRRSLLADGVAVVLQLAVEPEVSGFAFSVDPISNDKTSIVIESVYGSSDVLSQEAVTPDHFEFDKATLEETYMQVGVQDKQIVRVGSENQTIAVSGAHMARQKAPSRVMREAAKYARDLERHYTKPQEVEWVWDRKKVWVVANRSLNTVAIKAQEGAFSLKAVLKGAAGAGGMASGKVVVITSLRDLDEVRKGDILVAAATNSEYLPAMKKAVAVVTDRGGRATHAARASRELGIPAVVGAVSATKDLRAGQIYTVNGTAGEVYRGSFAPRSVKLTYEFPVQVPVVQKQARTATKVMVDLSEMSRAVEVAQQSADGVGVLRSEPLLKEIGIHPQYAIGKKREKEYIEKLAEGLVKVSTLFGDTPVIYRLSNFGSDEYREMEGGREREDYEKNLLLGYRGAARHVAEPEALALELAAIKQARNVHGCQNLWLWVPLVRTPEELASVKQLVTAAGLHRSANFRIFMTVQTPSNVLRLADFAKIGIDGAVVLVEDLAQLVLGVDLGSGKVAGNYEILDAAVLEMLERAAVEGRKLGLTMGIDGSGVWSSLAIIEKVVAWGYSSVSVEAGAVEGVRGMIVDAEKKLVEKKS